MARGTTYRSEIVGQGLFWSGCFLVIWFFGGGTLFQVPLDLFADGWSFGFGLGHVGMMVAACGLVMIFLARPR
ncbi:hypothetical protein JNW90_13255 [Micromonospora sp. STR1s_5]|nr:hypothetical protein [Micromonospora sp. STR1s_5]